MNILQNFLQNVAGKNHKEGLTEFLKDKLCKNLFSEKKKKTYFQPLSCTVISKTFLQAWLWNFFSRVFPGQLPNLPPTWHATGIMHFPLSWDFTYAEVFHIYFTRLSICFSFQNKIQLPWKPASSITVYEHDIMKHISSSKKYLLTKPLALAKWEH